MKTAPHDQGVTEESKTSEKNTDKADQFLRIIGKDPSKTWFRTITKGKGANTSRLGKDLHGLGAAALEADNKNGANIYFITGDANQASGKNKKTGKPTGCVEDSDIHGCHVVFVEWDDQPIDWQITAWQELNLPEPTAMVSTGGKSIHCYWVLKEPMQPEAWKLLQARLISFAGGDAQCKNPSRLMRLPGFRYISKETGRPTEKVAELIHQANVTYTAAEIASCLPQPEIENELVEVDFSSSAKSNKSSNKKTREFTPRTVEEIKAAAVWIKKRIGGQGTYEEDRNALCGCSAALAEAGVADPDGEALRLLGHKWPNESDARQVLESCDTRKAASFWAIAGENGYDLSRKGQKKKPKKTYKTPSCPPQTKEQKHASLQALIQRLSDGWDPDTRKPQGLSPGTLAQVLPAEYFVFNELDFRAYFKSSNGYIEITDADLDSAYVVLTGKGWGIGSDAVVKAIMHVARQNSFHPVRNYLQVIRADESIEPYDLDQVAPKLFRSPKPLHTAMMRKWLIGAAARALNPGCQMDYCLVLKGGQGLGKSTSLKALAGEDWFTSSHADQNKDFLLNVHSCWIYEQAELESLTSKRQAGTLKNLITSSTDTFRKPYARTAERVPRHSVFCGTVNEHQFLQDDTGNRRYWVIPIEGTEKLDKEAIAKERDAIWKAAVIAHEKGELPMLTEELEAESADQNEEFNEQDAWVGMIQAWMDGDPLLRWNKDSGDPDPRPFEPDVLITSAEILYSAGLKRPDAITRADEMRLGKTLRPMGFEKKKRGIRGWIFELCSPTSPTSSPT